MKYYLIVGALICSTSFFTHAQTQVVKCIDDKGNITYNNQKSKSKGMQCTDTNLGTIDQLKSPPRSLVNKGINSNNSSAGAATISPQDQAFRDLKRREILMSEMNQEKNQLENVKDMLLKVKKTDESQVKQLNGLLQNHQSNINTLEKELKIVPTDFSNIVSSVIPGLGIPKNKNNESGVEFKIEGATVINPPKTVTSTVETTNVIKPAIKMPDLDNMRGELNNLKRARENKPEQLDKSQHIEIRRRQPGVNISQASLKYMPLPTPLSVPDLGIGQ